MSDQIPNDGLPPIRPVNENDAVERIIGRVLSAFDGRFASLENRLNGMDARIDARLSAPPVTPRRRVLEGAGSLLKGYRTVIAAAILAVTPAAVEYFGNVDWQSLGLSPATAVVISGIIVVLRAMSTTPIGSSKPLPNSEAQEPQPPAAQR